jgi:hypothetical protein
LTFIIGSKEIMPTFVVREPEKGPPLFVGDVFDHSTYTAVVVEQIDIDYRTMPVERVVTYRACTRQELEENGYI